MHFLFIANFSLMCEMKADNFYLSNALLVW